MPKPGEARGPACFHDLNGVEGAAERVDEATGRFHVHFDTGATITARRSNLVSLWGAPWPTPLHCEMRGLVAQPELNAANGMAVSLVSLAERYVVRIGPAGVEPRVACVRPRNLVALPAEVQDDGHMLTYNGRCFCSMHRFEKCTACFADYRTE